MEFHFTGELADFDALVRRPDAMGHAAILARLDHQGTQLERLMELNEQTKALVGTLNTVTNDLAAALDEAVVFGTTKKTEYEAKIAELQAKVDAGDANVADVVDDLAAFGDAIGGAAPRLQAVATALRNIGASHTDPVPVPEPLPPVEDPPVTELKRKK